MVSKDMTRRDFLVRAAKLGAAGGGLLALSSAGLPAWLGRIGGGSPEALAAGTRAIAEAAPAGRYWYSLATAAGDCSLCHGEGSVDVGEPFDHAPGIVRCVLCSHECAVPVGKRGRCGVRENVDGELRSLVYGRPAAVHIDPIEKKPFYHFLPGREAYSIGTAGCPLRCQFCQNWELSQASPEDLRGEYVGPERIVRSAERRDVPIVAFTYNEPTVFLEYFSDIARMGKERGLRHVLVSCGFMNEAPLEEMCDVLDAIKIDLKGYSEKFYRDVCHADLKPVLRNIRRVAERGVHLEIVNLVVPTLNDSEKDLRGLARWVAAEVGPDVPVHFTRFHPDYRLLNLPPTPIATLERAREIAFAEGLHYPYVGNVPGHPGNHTYCPGCGEIVNRRNGFQVEKVRLEKGRCLSCETAIAGVWS